jgi:hypothetical protein
VFKDPGYRILCRTPPASGVTDGERWCNPIQILGFLEECGGGGGGGAVSYRLHGMYMYMNASMNLLWMRSGKCMRQKGVSAGRVGVVWRGSEVERDEGSSTM